jgi:hypothetical protein
MPTSLIGGMWGTPTYIKTVTLWVNTTTIFLVRRNSEFITGLTTFSYESKSYATDCMIWPYGGQTLIPGQVMHKVAVAHNFSEYFGFPCKFPFRRLLHTNNYLPSGTGTRGQIVTDIPRGLSLALKTKKTKLHGLSPRANYTDRATAACRRSDCQLLRIEGAMWSAWRIPTAVFSVL